MTLGNMRQNGVRAVIASCLICDHKAEVNVDALSETIYPRRFGSDSGHLVADPIGNEVRFLPLDVPESLKSSEHNALLLVRHLIEEAHVGGDLLRWFGPRSFLKE